MIRNAWIVALLAAVLAVPLLLRPDNDLLGTTDDTLVIITPHNEATRFEFTRAFREQYKKATGRTVRLDWRTPGGTSEISRYLASEYLAAFRYRWRDVDGHPWNATVQASFDNAKQVPDDSPADDTPEEAARRAFLASDVSCGIDLFFGGGTYDFALQAGAGRLVDSGIAQRHPDWLATIPLEAGGEPYRDSQNRWIGACLSAFGICYNTDALRRLGIDRPPAQWSDLADPEYFGAIALSDPTQSGSVAKAFEMLIQQQMQLRLRDQPAEAARLGWADGIRLIRRAAANARYFTDSSSKIPWDVEAGDAAAGMCIDFYGRFQSESVRRPDGSSRLQYVTPRGGSSFGADPIGMLRGAPHPEVAKAFIDFVLSLEGQKLWCYKTGTPSGPVKYALRRLPIRPEIYAKENASFRSDPGVNPYEQAGAFTYHPEWTAALFRTISFVVRTVCIDPHPELKSAWGALIEAGFPPEATAAFDDVSAVDYAAADATIRPVLRSSERIEQVRLAKSLSDHYRNQYKLAKKLAESRR